MLLWNAWSQNEENVKYVSVDTTKHMIYTDIPHSTHNCIPHNIYYTTYYPWRVAVRITVMSVMWSDRHVSSAVSCQPKYSREGNFRQLNISYFKFTFGFNFRMHVNLQK